MHTDAPDAALAESLQTMYEENEILWNVPEVAWAALALERHAELVEAEIQWEQLTDAAPRPITDSLVFQAALAGRHSEFSQLSVRYRCSSVRNHSRVRSAGARENSFVEAKFRRLDPLGMMNTHPAVIGAARETFLRLGASAVLIGEGPAMDRDTQAVIESISFAGVFGPVVEDFRGFKCG